MAMCIGQSDHCWLSLTVFFREKTCKHVNFVDHCCKYLQTRHCLQQNKRAVCKQVYQGLKAFVEMAAAQNQIVCALLTIHHHHVASTALCNSSSRCSNSQSCPVKHRWHLHGFNMVTAMVQLQFTFDLGCWLAALGMMPNHVWWTSEWPSVDTL